jgi:RNA polymerase sigma-70 factor (ECF subfamily)
VRGRRRLARFLTNLGRRYDRLAIEPVALNGELGIVLLDGAERVAAMAMHVEDGLVRAIHVIRAEDKLAALDLHPDLI